MVDQLSSIIKLLDDPDEKVYQLLEKQLFTQGESIVKLLEDAWEKTDNELVQERIENITQKILFNHVAHGFTTWIASKEHSLFDAAFYAAKYQYPDLEYDSLKAKIQNIVTDIHGEIHENLTPLEKIRAVNHILYREYRFTRSFSGLKSPHHFFLNNVIENRKGNFISLAILYATVCQEAGLPLYGLNLPDNFAMAYIDLKKPTKLFNEHSALFYTNPLNKGAVFSKFEIDDFLRRLNMSPDSYFYTPISNIETIKVYIESIIFSFQKQGYQDKVDDYNAFFEIIA